MDGLRDTGLYDRDVFDYEAIEVYKDRPRRCSARFDRRRHHQVLKTHNSSRIYDFAVTAAPMRNTRRLQM